MVRERAKTKPIFEKEETGNKDKRQGPGRGNNVYVVEKEQARKTTLRGRKQEIKHKSRVKD